MREISVGDVVRSTQGRDKDHWFFVLAADATTVTLVDGDIRKLASPKRKNRRHVAPVGVLEHPLREQIERGATLIDAHLRKALSALKEEKLSSADTE